MCFKIKQVCKLIEAALWLKRQNSPVWPTQRRHICEELPDATPLNAPKKHISAAGYWTISEDTEEDRTVLHKQKKVKSKYHSYNYPTVTDISYQVQWHSLFLKLHRMSRELHMREREKERLSNEYFLFLKASVYVKWIISGLNYTFFPLRFTTKITQSPIYFLPVWIVSCIALW